MKDIIILGAGGTGLDFVSVIDAINSVKPTWNILGFLDDNAAMHNKFIGGYLVLGAIDDCYLYPDAFFVSSIADAKNRCVRRKIYNRVAKYNLNFATLIHPSVIIFNDVIIGEGCVIRACSLLASCVRLGKNVSISTGCMINHEVQIGDHSTISSGVVFGSGVIVGDDNYIGLGTKTKHSITIESDVTTGVGTVVLSNIKKIEGDCWIGIPARPLIKK